MLNYSGFDSNCFANEIKAIGLKKRSAMTNQSLAVCFKCSMGRRYFNFRIKSRFPLEIHHQHWETGGQPRDNRFPCAGLGFFCLFVAFEIQIGLLLEFSASSLELNINWFHDSIQDKFNEDSEFFTIKFEILYMRKSGTHSVFT